MNGKWLVRAGASWWCVVAGLGMHFACVYVSLAYEEENIYYSYPCLMVTIRPVSMLIHY